jgi:hypothetical protein
VEIIFELLRNSLYVVLEDDVNIESLQDKLPMSISGSLVYGCALSILYLGRAHLGRPKPDAHCQPLAKDEVDTTAYAQLRPGMLLHTNLAETASLCWRTAGVVAEDLQGLGVLISCGLRGSKRIWQGNDESFYAGEVVSNIPGTSVVLIQIDKRERDMPAYPPLTNQVFELMSGAAPKLKRHRSSGDRLVHRIGYLNSSFTGNMEVTVVGHSVQFQRVDDEDPEKPRLVVCDWLYTGQVEGNAHKMTPPGGTTGSAIWDDEGVVLGFWDCYIPIGLFAGMANAVSASELSDMGIHLMPC